ncbi:MAG: DNA gyrase C-terminal beta-propeller domain-containing protein, partial [Pseudomonadota bacterium]
MTDVILNNLYKQTALQSVFGINMVALHDGQPKLMGLKDVLDAFLSHRREVITRRTLYELGKARDRAHVLEGQTVALANIDPVIEMIKASPSPAEAREALMASLWKPGSVLDMLERAGELALAPSDVEVSYGPVEVDGETLYRLSDVQAKAILDLQLQRLTGLEQEKIIKEYSDILDKIKALSLILTDPDRLTEVMREELEAVRDEFADERRTEIVQDHSDLTHEDLIPEEDVLVTLSHGGYAKAQAIDTYQAQRRGGRGRAAAAVRGEDFIDKFFVANTHDTLLCFSSRGMAYWLKVYQVPQAGRGARGKPLVNLLPLQPNERINAVLPVRSFDPDKYVFFATSSGTVKKTPLDAFSRPRASGIIAIDLRDDDKLVDVTLTNGDSEIMLVASSGKGIRFSEDDVRAMGRTAAGVRGIKLPSSHEVIALLKLSGGLILTATANGFGKRTRADEFSTQGRGGQGVIAIQTTTRNGRTVGALEVGEDDEVMLITSNGTLVRTPVEEISIVGRNTQGVRLIRLDNGDHLAGMARIAPIDEDSSQD